MGFWGLVAIRTTEHPVVALHLAPTFDHASSLARELSDEQRAARLTSKDRRFSVESYARRSRSALFFDENDRRPLTTLDAFAEASRWRPDAARVWSHRLFDIPPAQIRDIFARVPSCIMSSAAAEFGLTLLEFNRERIRVTVEGLP